MVFRGFVAVDVEENDKLESFSSRLKSSGADLKLVNLANIHITLKFLGDTREEQTSKIRDIISEGVRDVEPFKIELVGAGAFPNMNYIKVVWVGAKGAEKLADVASYLEDELEPLGYRKEKRRFSSHLTIARARSARNLEAVKRLLEEKQDEFFGEQLVDRITLKKSELTPKGPIYTVVEEVRFGE